MLTFTAMTTVSQGTVGLGLAISYFTRRGFGVSLPLNDNQPYDLVIDDGALHRVQVKTTRQRSKNGRNYVVELKSVRHNKTRNLIRALDSSSVDYVFIVVETEEQYLIPVSELPALTVLTLDERFDGFKVR